MDDKQYLIKLGERIKQLRKDKLMRQIDLSEKIGIEDSALRRIESGRVNSTIKMLRKIAKGLEVDVIQLLDNLENKG
ncbi:MAG: helix-turn-helix transcriptional regulator [Flavobacteriales bacterium]|nr:helix-turn-helix transcriptional regulator [Flavobacteriales bacterium]